ncbi:hypothetical protein HELRODRAFT_192487 [Helobdella robusta]|uniref:PX domain-containing protein n=1 Tax=Helobdella robusta TaxID=6412 RepID=T1FU06_HELRO|nr:hypothetical protein HELRODRAFT_192487 [Helobdella robusta]ESO00935.1 hypothetical protein HELRODRAFT_192487 [Helobdella robusta]
MADSKEDENDSNYHFYRNYNSKITNEFKQNSNLPPGARVVIIEKSETGFGFNVRGQVNEGGQLRSINGELYAPMQHVSAVLRNGSADRAGVLKGDRILEVWVLFFSLLYFSRNGVNVEGATHKQVVDLIRSGDDRLELTVISVPHRTAEDSLDGSDDSSCPSTIDYSEKRSLPITIPDYQTVESGGQKYTMFNIHMAGRHLCSRRYSEFYKLHTLLKQEFHDFNFPKLPGKKFFQLSEHQLDTRRRGLEQYLEKVCTVVVIAESDIMRDFLSSSSSSSSLPTSSSTSSSLSFIVQNKVELKISLPNHSISTLNIQRHLNAAEVYQLLADKLGWSSEVSACFFLFEIEENNFERKLDDNEKPHALYIGNYNTSSVTCISLNRCVYSIGRERNILFKDPTAVDILYHLAVAQLDNEEISVSTTQTSELKALKDSNNTIKFIEYCQGLPNYACKIFPHCKCDARKDGHVITCVGLKGISLQACTANGQSEGQVVEFDWSDINSLEADQSALIFTYKKPELERSESQTLYHGTKRITIDLFLVSSLT